jgi:hypothetical protein
MAWMFVFGLGNLMIGAPQAIFLEDRLGASYLQAILATTIIPLNPRDAKSPQAGYTYPATSPISCSKTNATMGTLCTSTEC